MRNESNIVLSGNRGQRPALPPQPSAATPAVFYIEPADAGGSNSSTAPGSIVRYLYLLKRHQWLLAGVAALGVVASFVLTGLQSPVYRASTTIEIMSLPDSSAGTGFGGGGGQAFPADSYIATQVRVLKSRTLQQQVKDNLLAESTEWSLARPQWESWAKQVGLKTPGDDLPQTAQVVLPAIELEVISPPGTRLIEVVAQSADPKFATFFANSLVQSYIDSELTARWDTAERSTDWLEEQLGDIKQQLTTAEYELRAYDQANGILPVSETRDAGDDQLTQIQANLVGAQAERIARQSVFEQTEAGAADRQAVIDTDRVASIRTRITDLRQRLAELNAQFTSEHPRVKQTQAQIEELEAALVTEQSTAANRVRTDYEAAARREALLTSSYAAETRRANARQTAMVGHETRQHEVDSLRVLYDSLYRSVHEAGVQSASKISSVRVVDTAEIPRIPFSPEPIRNLALCLISGLLLGVTFVIGRDWINQSLKAPGETPLHLGVPELGIIPDAASVLGSSKKKNALSSLSSAMGGEDTAMQVFDPRFAAVTESFRNVVASILAVRKDGARPRVILATSASHGDGKSTTMGILAASLAEVSNNVVLIDGDMRKPTLHKLFGVPNDWGLSDVLRERTSLKDMPMQALLRHTEIPGLHLLTSGPGAASISNLLYSKRMEELIDYLRGQCDTILIDAPPLLAVSDARILGQYCDGAVLVIRAGETTRDEASFAAEMLRHSGVPLIGTILNRADPKAAAAYGYGYGTYGPYNETSIGA